MQVPTIEFLDERLITALKEGKRVPWWSFEDINVSIHVAPETKELLVSVTRPYKDGGLELIRSYAITCESLDRVNQVLTSDYYKLLAELDDGYTFSGHDSDKRILGFLHSLKTPSKESTTVGRKDDKGKLRYSLIPWQVLEGLASVLTFGAKKYAPNNWKVLVDPEERYEDAMWRHIMEYKKGERLDSDSKLPHLWHAVTNLAFLIYFDIKKDSCSKGISDVQKTDTDNDNNK